MTEQDAIRIVEKYPIPLFDEEKMVEEQRSLINDRRSSIDSEDDIIECPDTFHDEYIDEMSSTDEWSAFRCLWPYGNSGWIYFWNRQLGYGFKISSDWEVICGLVEIMNAFTDEYESEDFTPNRYAWETP